MKKFLVSKNTNDRIDYINQIKGKKVVIFNKKSDLTELFDDSIDMKLLMNNDYFIEKINSIDSKTTLVLLDVLIKNGIYVHPYGKIFRFTEIVSETLIIDNSIFRFTEKNIVRPFLFIDTSVFGTSMIGFHINENNTVDSYYKKIKSYIDCKISEVNVNIIEFNPTKIEIDEYNNLKKNLIDDFTNTKTKIVNTLFNYIDNLASKKKLINSLNIDSNTYIVESNKLKSKFNLYNALENENIKTVIFISSSVFGVDEKSINTISSAITQHNKLIRLLNEKV